MVVTTKTDAARLNWVLTGFFALAWLVFLALRCSNVVVDLGATMEAFYFLVGWGLMFIVRIVIAIWRRNAAQAGLQLGIEPIALLLGWLLVTTGVMAKARFHLSRGALEQTAAEAAAGRIVIVKGQRISAGFFSFSEVNVEKNRVKFVLGRELFGDYGLAFSPSGRPMDASRETFEPYAGQWYVWRRKDEEIHRAFETAGRAVSWLLQNLNSSHPEVPPRK